MISLNIALFADWFLLYYAQAAKWILPNARDKEHCWWCLLSKMPTVWIYVYQTHWYLASKGAYLNSSPTPPTRTPSHTSVAYMCQRIGSALVQIMACRLLSAKPLSKPVLGYCQLDPQEHFGQNLNVLLMEMYLKISSRGRWVNVVEEDHLTYQISRL